VASNAPAYASNNAPAPASSVPAPAQSAVGHRTTGDFRYNPGSYTLFPLGGSGQQLGWSKPATLRPRAGRASGSAEKIEAEAAAETDFRYSTATSSGKPASAHSTTGEFRYNTGRTNLTPLGGSGQQLGWSKLAAPRSGFGRVSSDAGKELTPPIDHSSTGNFRYGSGRMELYPLGGSGQQMGWAKPAPTRARAGRASGSADKELKQSADVGSSSEFRHGAGRVVLYPLGGSGQQMGWANQDTPRPRAGRASSVSTEEPPKEAVGVVQPTSKTLIGTFQHGTGRVDPAPLGGA